MLFLCQDDKRMEEPYKLNKFTWSMSPLRNEVAMYHEQVLVFLNIAGRLKLFFLLLNAYGRYFC